MSTRGASRVTLTSKVPPVPGTCWCGRLHHPRSGGIFVGRQPKKPCQPVVLSSYQRRAASLGMAGPGLRFQPADHSSSGGLAVSDEKTSSSRIAAAAFAMALTAPTSTRPPHSRVERRQPYLPERESGRSVARSSVATRSTTSSSVTSPFQASQREGEAGAGGRECLEP